MTAAIATTAVATATREAGVSGCDNAPIEHAPQVYCAAPGELSAELDANVSGLLDQVHVLLETNPQEYALDMEPQELDAVVIGPDVFGAGVPTDRAFAWLRHVKPGGVLILLGYQSSEVTPIPDLAVSRVEGTSLGFHAVPKPELQGVVDD